MICKITKYDLTQPDTPDSVIEQLSQDLEKTLDRAILYTNIPSVVEIAGIKDSGNDWITKWRGNLYLKANGVKGKFISSVDGALFETIYQIQLIVRYGTSFDLISRNYLQIFNLVDPQDVKYGDNEILVNGIFHRVILRPLPGHQLTSSMSFQFRINTPNITLIVDPNKKFSITV